MVKDPPLKIAFLHKALLYGGAERLILDMALAFRENHKVTIYTCEYDKDKTFPDFQTSKVAIKHVGKFIPARIKGKFAAVFNLIRMLYLSLYLICTWASYDLIVVDQITLPIPLLRLFNFRLCSEENTSNIRVSHRLDIATSACCTTVTSPKPS